MAMNNEIQKLQKEIADLSLVNDYEGVPSGRFIRNKCNHSLGSTGTTTSPCTTSSSNELDHHTPNPDSSSSSTDAFKFDKPQNFDLVNSFNKLCESKRLFLNSQIESCDGDDAKYNNNLPDVTYVEASNRTCSSTDETDNIYVNSSEDDFKSLSPARELLLSKHSTVVGDDVKGEVARLNAELESCRKNFELEKIKWLEEKEKVLIYQRQLQKNYLDVIKRTQELEKKLENS